MPLTLAEWLERCETREEALMMAHRKSGLSMSAMAAEIGLSATRVGQLIRRVEVAKRSRTAYFADCGSMQVSSPHLARWAHAGYGVLVSDTSIVLMSENVVLVDYLDYH